MNKGQIELFVKIAESGSFTRAGQEMNMTQPAVSRAISTLETELDVQLLVRDRRGIALTAVGRRILVIFRDILKGFSKVEQEVAAEKGLDKGLISVGTFPVAAAYFIPKIIAAISRQYPNLEFRLHEGTIMEVREWLDTGLVDVGLLIPPLDGQDTFPLFREKLYAVVPTGHPLAQQAIVRVKDLENEPMLVCKSGYEPPVIDLFQRAETELTAKYEVRNYNTALNMVREGLAVAVMSRLSLLSVPDGVAVRELEPEAYRDIHLSVRSAENCSIAVRLFIDTALELFAGKEAEDLKRSNPDPDLHRTAF
ncbi:DNA-binding transcriptional LysR family regulator [Paenibacillus forsythiae]|uniref:DNA-binding transcriptional LysR family regulator n=1 Tax=Paenibacillus forsythiae TaxID=365616 RepID=A0ABU3H3M9_9BACL|nr:LysR family transcriptional regulator [Paenibacillus forsythiae]MDT3425426.1 DNA-binding transcriptional LysR family regulator [Paenibacillus forsythiae]